MRHEWTEYNRTAAEIYRYLDREAIAHRKRKEFKRQLRKVPRKFHRLVCCLHRAIESERIAEDDISSTAAKMMGVGLHQINRQIAEALLFIAERKRKRHFWNIPKKVIPHL